MTTEQDARADLDRIRELVACDFMGQQGEICDKCKQAIRDDPFDIEVRSRWVKVKDLPFIIPNTEHVGGFRPVEFRIVMRGENVRIVGTLDAKGVPKVVVMQEEDEHYRWWSMEDFSDDEQADLLTYARAMDFGG